MSAILAPAIGSEHRSPQDVSTFFRPSDKEKIRQYETREDRPLCRPGESCKTNLFFGFFFDGTRNNYLLAEKTKDHSNVARLYDCFPGKGVTGVLPPETDCQPERYPHFFKVYVPGVASPFVQIGDSGEGFEGMAGGAGGRLGERRIIWALAQAINNLHRYFLKVPLLGDSDMQRLFHFVELSRTAREVMDARAAAHVAEKVRYRVGGTRDELRKVLSRLHSAIAPHRPDAKTGKAQKIDPSVVKTIYISTFGFSRGASEARVFTNWLISLCRLDAEMLGRPGDLTLGGFKVEFDFVGIFDTVASVGLANSAMLWDGHAAWADADDSLRIPPEVQKCLHLVAAHELRRSFPVDSIAVNGVLPSGCEEVVVPGVHSDIGCGYCPCEQGKGIDRSGSDMLSRIPLLMMYRAARINGAPLKLEFASDVAKARFAVSTRTIDAFNAYIATCKETTGPIHKIMREQARKQIEWRVERRVNGPTPIQKTASFSRASTLHQNDIHSAALEFEEEVGWFEDWLSKKGVHFLPGSQPPGFRDEREAEWEEIATWWKTRTRPSPEVMRFFDEYVHDSRASFKCMGDADNEAELRKILDRWVAMRKERVPVVVGKADYGRRDSGLTPDQRRAADEYATTGKIPRMINGGRESFTVSSAGYLRYRRIYGGSNNCLLS